MDLKKEKELVNTILDKIRFDYDSEPLMITSDRLSDTYYCIHMVDTHDFMSCNDLAEYEMKIEDEIDGAQIVSLEINELLSDIITGGHEFFNHLYEELLYMDEGFLPIHDLMKEWIKRNRKKYARCCYFLRPNEDDPKAEVLMDLLNNLKILQFLIDGNYYTDPKILYNIGSKICGLDICANIYKPEIYSSLDDKVQEIDEDDEESEDLDQLHIVNKEIVKYRLKFT